MKLVVAEKPSVMRDIAAVLGANQTNADGALCGNGYMVAAARGHLLRNKTPDEYEEYKKWDLSVLPIIPDFEFVPIEKNIDALHTLAKLMNSREIDEIIEATDAGREGECIFRYIYNYVGCKKPVSRLWISSMTEASIRAGFDNLKPVSEYDNLYSAGYTRSKITLGVERGNAAFDILHVRGGENVLVDDFTRHSELSKDSSLLAIIRKTAAEIGYDKVNSYPLLENGRYGEPSFVPFDKWAAENKQFNLTGGRKMEHNTTFEVSSISKIDNGGGVKALANVVINGELAVRGVKVMEGEKGAFVAMPSKKMGTDYADVAFPITKEAREALNNAVMKSYEQLKASPEKTIKNDVPTADHATSSVSVSLKAVDKNNLKAAGQITLDGCFVVRDVKVLTGSENKPFVSMPSYQTQTGDYAQYALPITKEFHEKLEKAVIGNYHSLGKTEYKGVKYAELGDKNDIAHLPKQNNRFAASLMAELDKAGIKYQARVEDMTSISVHKSDMPRVTDIKNELVKTLNPEKQTNSAPKHKR